MSKPGNIWRKVHGKITKKPTNFSWLIEEKLAGSGIPTSHDEFAWLLNQGVNSMVILHLLWLTEIWQPLSQSLIILIHFEILLSPVLLVFLPFPNECVTVIMSSANCGLMVSMYFGGGMSLTNMLNSAGPTTDP